LDQRALDLYVWLGNGTGFNSTKVGTYPSGWKVVGAADIDGDGKSDLLFHNAATRQFSYRIMNGVVTVRSALISGVGNGYSVATTGDFNGDGRADIVWTSAALDLYVWLGNGAGFVSARAGTYSNGWALIR
jgi:FG-GAP repeat.